MPPELPMSCELHSHSMLRPCPNGLYVGDYLSRLPRQTEQVKLGHLDATPVLALADARERETR